MGLFQRAIWIVLGILVLQMFSSFPAARAADLVLCVNKSTRVVTYPASGKCTANSFALNVSSNTIKLPKSHTTTAAITPKSGPLKVFVPNVLAMDVNKARLTLSNLGLKVAVKVLKKGPNARVIQVVPGVMSPVASGSVVTIVVG